MEPQTILNSGYGREWERRQELEHAVGVDPMESGAAKKRRTGESVNVKPRPSAATTEI